MVLALTTLLLFATLGWCQKERWLFGHRGNSREFPENTLEAFRSCIDLGCDVNELDIHISADDVVVVIHDFTLDRTTNCSGEVSSYTLAQLKQCDAGYRFTRDGGATYPFRGQGVAIPTMIEVFEQIPGIFNIDMKDNNAADLLNEAIVATGVEDRCIVGSFYDAVTRYFRDLNADVQTFAATVEATVYAGQCLANSTNGTPPFTHLELPYLPPALDVELMILVANADGAKVDFWTINDLEDMEYLLLAGADGIITDDVRDAAALYRQLGYKP